MVEARRMVRRHFGRDHHPVRRRLAKVLVAIAWPPAVLLHLWHVRHRYEEATLKRVPGAFWAAIRHNVLPSEYYVYGLWQADRSINIDNYLYDIEAPRLFKVLNRCSQPDPIVDKLAFYELCNSHNIPTPEILAAFAPTGKLIDFPSSAPPRHDLFVKARTGTGLGAERLRWDRVFFQSSRGYRVEPEEVTSYLGIAPEPRI